MEFIAPTVLWSLFLLGIPILIHLFQFKKRKKVYFSNIALLQKVKQEHSNKQRLKHLLILAARLLALTALIFAFAQPFIPVVSTNDSNAKAVVIYLDNSFSQESIGENGNLFDVSKQYALKIIQAHSANQQFTIVTNDFLGKYNNTYSKSQAEDLIQTIQPSAQFKTANDILLKIKSLTNNSAQVYWLSDFQKSNFNEVQFSENQENLQIIAIPHQALKTDNLVVDSTYFLSPVRALNGTDQLVVITKNTGSSAYESAKLELKLNNKVASFKNIQLEPFSSRYDTLNFTSPKSEFIQGEVTIDDSNFPFDNNHYFSYSLPKTIKVAHLYGEPYSAAFKHVFGTDSIFKLTEIQENQINANELNNYNLIIINNLSGINSGLASAIQSASIQGSSIFVFGGPKTSLQQYNSLLSALDLPTFKQNDTSKTTINSANFDALLFRNVFEKKPKNPTLPTLFGYYTKNELETFNGTVETIFKSAKNESLLSAYYTNSKTCYVANFGVHPKESTFSKNSLFVPILLNAGFQSLKTNESYATIGKNELIKINQAQSNAESYLLVQANNQEFKLIPKIQNTNNARLLNPMGAINTAGFYNITSEGKTIDVAAYNYNKSEFDLSYLSESEITEWFQNAGIQSVNLFNKSIEAIQTTVNEANNGIQLWKYFIIATLLFLLIEVLLSRFLKD